MDREFKWLKRAISKRDAGKTLLFYLQKELKISGRGVKDFLERGGCRLNGMVERFGSVRLSVCDKLLFKVETQEGQKPPSFKLPILFEDQHLLFCHKPIGLASDERQFSSLLEKKIFLVHRLDKQTSGVMVVAKTKRVQPLLERIFWSREMEKIYFALVLGDVRGEKGEIDNYLAKKKGSVCQATWEKSRKGLHALTYWQRIRSCKGLTLLQCQPKTGRTHQLRVHLSGMGHPILGDFHYGRKQLKGERRGDRLFLHAYSLTFCHPISKKRITQIAPLSPSFAQLLT